MRLAVDQLQGGPRQLQGHVPRRTAHVRRRRAVLRTVSVAAAAHAAADDDSRHNQKGSKNVLTEVIKEASLGLFSRT